jgi:two-component system, cell cycle sensor histidine kinase and response regulator CckA
MRGAVTPAALLDALPHPLALLDGKGRLVTANPAFRALIEGFAPGSEALRLLPEAAEALAAGLRGTPGRVGLARRALSLAITPCAGGAVLALTPTQEGQDERLALLGRLAGGIAHDFNNLLAVILGAAAAARVAPLDDTVAVEVAAIEAAAERGAALVRQLLAFARQQVLAPRSVALNDTVTQFVALLPRLMGPGIRVETALEQPSRHIRVDPDQWSRVLLNLAVNARDAMGAAGVLRFSTGRRLVLAGEMVAGELLPPGRYATLEVRDTGPGIPPEVLPRIFEPFYSTKLEAGGTGLGLATVQGIVGQSGGRIEVECPPEGGTLFRILLPRAEPAPAPAAEPVMALAPPPPVGQILLVDDERSLLRVAALSLRQAGHDVVAHEDAEDALDALREGLRPLLLATDVAMPGLDGLGLARAARALLPDLPVLLLSGYSAASVGGAPGREGFAFLAKPFTPEGLRAAVDAALAGGARSDSQGLSPA